MKSYEGLRKSSITARRRSYRDRLDRAAAHVREIEEEPREEVRGEQARPQADEQRDSEALDRAGPERQQDDRRSHDREMGIDDRPERPSEPRLDGGSRCLPDP